jgi:hypothetical protein
MYKTFTNNSDSKELDYLLKNQIDTMGENITVKVNPILLHLKSIFNDKKSNLDSRR